MVFARGILHVWSLEFRLRSLSLANKRTYNITEGEKKRGEKLKQHYPKKWRLGPYLEMEVGHEPIVASTSCQHSTGVQWVGTNMNSPPRWRAVHTR